MSSGSAAVGGQRRTATIPFANPGNIKKGFVNATFDIEYALIQCSGELHVAYSVIDDSVRQKKAGYYLDGRHYLLDKPAPSTITSVPLKGIVYRDRVVGTIGRFADDHAAKAMGFGCFSGQSKKVATIADLGIGGTDKPSPDALKKFMDELTVKFETPEILTSTSVEADIRAGNAQASAMPKNDAMTADATAGADERARRKAERDAAFAVKQAAYEKDLAAQRKAVADFEAAQQQMVADKAAAAARAQAVQQEFARQQAAHAAVLEQHRKERAAYDELVGAKPRQ